MNYIVAIKEEKKKAYKEYFQGFRLVYP